MKVTIKAILDKRKVLKGTNKYPVAIRITSNRVPVSFRIEVALSESDWKKMPSNRLGKELDDIKCKIAAEEARALRIIKDLGTFTFDAFRDKFYAGLNKAGRSNKMVSKSETETAAPVISEGRNKKYGKRKFDRIRSNVDYAEMGPLAVAFGEYIKELEFQQRIGTSESYFCTLSNLTSYRRNLRVEDVTVRFLYEYEQWMLKKGRSYTTIGIYIRNLRAIINLPENRKLLADGDYPFGKRKYQIPTGRNVKKALDLTDIKKIYEYNPASPGEFEMYARDMWLFGYLSNGINPKDIAFLKYENIHDDFIVVQRQKTRFTTRTNPIPIQIPVNEEIQRIIDQWGNKQKEPANYVFPVLTPGLSPHRQRELVHGFIGLINDWMKRIAKTVGIEKKVRTMEYRHSAATILRNSGASTEFIKEVFGHQSVKTTQNYLDSFGNAVKKEFSKKLLAFK